MSKFNENYEVKDINKENEKTVKKYKKKDKLRLKVEKNFCKMKILKKKQ